MKIPGFIHTCLALILIAPALAASDDDNRPVVKVGFGFDKPPYVIVDGEIGLWPDIVGEALDRMGYQMRPSFISLARMNRSLETGSLDMITGLPKIAVTAPCYSRPFVGYQNVAFHHRNHAFTIQKPADLLDKNVIAFQKASVILGAEFRQMAGANDQYQEVPSQVTQVRSFVAGRNEVAVMDRNIFNWVFDNMLIDVSRRMRREDIREAPIFKIELNHGAGFADEALCNAFAGVLDEMEQDGTLTEIRQRYGILHLDQLKELGALSASTEPTPLPRP